MKDLDSKVSSEVDRVECVFEQAIARAEKSDDPFVEACHLFWCARYEASGLVPLAAFEHALSAYGWHSAYAVRAYLGGIVDAERARS